MNVSEQVLRLLAQEGVKRIYGVAGDALNTLVTAIGAQKQVSWIKMKHEGNASYAAYGQAALSGELAVCASTVGPGALHLVNGLYNAKKERVPVLAITGQVPVAKLGTNYHQEVDLVKVFEDICAYQAVLRSPEAVGQHVQRAMRIAINQRTVCRIELPADVAEMPAASSSLPVPVFRSHTLLQAPTEQLMQAVKLINGAERVGILAGAGCRGARAEVLALAAKLKAPVTHTLRAADIFDHESPHVVGLTGLIGNSSGYRAVMDCDVLLMLGTDFPYIDFLPKQAQIIQVDIRAENIGNRIPVQLGLHAAVQPTVAYLTSACAPKDDGERLQALTTDFSQWKTQHEQLSEKASGAERVQPEALARLMSEAAAADAVFAIDTGTAAIWASNFMNFKQERRILGSFNHGSMAVALPAAIGAQLEEPKREVWVLVGDGAFHMSMQDLSTAVEYQLPIKVVVLNNKELGFVKIEMEEAGLAPNYDALGVKNFDFAALCRLIGGEGVEVRRPEELPAALAAAKAATKPCVVNVHVEPGALSLPPHISFEQARHFGLSKLRELYQSLKGDKRNWENIKSEVNSLLKTL